jgi:hypothetical protein
MSSHEIHSNSEDRLLKTQLLAPIAEAQQYAESLERAAAVELVKKPQRLYEMISFASDMVSKTIECMQNDGHLGNFHLQLPMTPEVRLRVIRLLVDPNSDISDLPEKDVILKRAGTRIRNIMLIVPVTDQDTPMGDPYLKGYKDTPEKLK